MSGFAESLEQLGGDLFGQISELGGKYLEMRTEKERAKYMTNPTESIQATTAQPTPPNPVKGVNANGETMVQHTGESAQGQSVPLWKDKNVQIIGGSVLAVALLGLAYKAVK